MKDKSNMKDKILVTGGLGFIGSNFIASLEKLNIEVDIIDNLSNSSETVFTNLTEYVSFPLRLHKIDLIDKDELSNFFDKNKNFSKVVHFAGLKSVAESLKKPLSYFKNNFIGTQNLLTEMLRNNITKIIFSSSATIYGNPLSLPIDENHELKPINPYGDSKLAAENLFKNIAMQYKNFSCISLRYFNPIGAHRSLIFGDFNNKPENLIPLICRSIKENGKGINILGSDYDTPDGTGIRDYIHVNDLVNAHIKALSYLDKQKGFIPINLGSGKGFSVLEIISNFEKVNNVKINRNFVGRRQGDVASVYTDTKKAYELLNWKAKLSLESMLSDSWNFFKKRVN